MLSDFPCWLNRDDREVGEALIAIGWYWLPDEQPETWDGTWEWKALRCCGWQFWATPGETCILAVRRGAVFGLCLEGQELDFRKELKRAREAIRSVTRLQDERRPSQLVLNLGV